LVTAGNKDYVATVATVATVGAAFVNELFMAKTNPTVATFAGQYFNSDFINKIHHL
jgi:hypothetical protein